MIFSKLISVMKADPSLAGNSRTRTLQRAAETVGGAPLLAEQLNVPLADLEQWLASTQPMPHEIFSRALDIVAAGPFRMRGTGAGALRSAQHAQRRQAHADKMYEMAAIIQESADRAHRMADRAQRDADAACDVADVERIFEDSRKRSGPDL